MSGRWPSDRAGAGHLHQVRRSIAKVPRRASRVCHLTLAGHSGYCPWGLPVSDGARRAGRTETAVGAGAEASFEIVARVVAVGELRQRRHCRRRV